jgi:hypothetical protein
MSHQSLIGAIGSAHLGAVFSPCFCAAANQSLQDKSGAGPMGRGVMMGHMPIQDQEMSQLMNKVMESMTAINNEKDPPKIESTACRTWRLDGSTARENDGAGQNDAKQGRADEELPRNEHSGKPDSK